MKDQKQLTPGESEVEERLRSAARTLRRLPNVKVQGYFSTWPTIIREPLEILQMEPEPLRITPSMADITEMEEVLFVWLKWLEPEERRLVWLRAERVRWKLQERVDAYYTAKEQIVATIMQIANRIHNPPPAERKMPEQIVAHDITKLKQAHMKLREMGDILGIETQALEI
jgi:hypothetical protein